MGDSKVIWLPQLSEYIFVHCLRCSSFYPSYEAEKHPCTTCGKTEVDKCRRLRDQLKARWFGLYTVVIHLKKWPCNRVRTRSRVRFGALIFVVHLERRQIVRHPEANILASLFEGLVIPNPADSTKQLPGVAASWEHSDDYSIWTFHLRPDARWSNGDSVTAGDFVFSVRRVLTASLGAPFSDFFFTMDRTRKPRRQWPFLFEGMEKERCNRSREEFHLLGCRLGEVEWN
jgi:ribosomal protein L37E